MAFESRTDIWLRFDDYTSYSYFKILKRAQEFRKKTGVNNEI